ncbi:MAG: lipoprotein NlpD [Gammaproteobacteria bacterium]
MINRIFIAWAFSVALIMSVAGCSNRPPTPVSDLSTTRQKVNIIRIVSPGDTLYGIAWGAGLDYRQLAQWNGLSAPYLLRSGQKLYLADTGRRKPAVIRKSTATKSSTTAALTTVIVKPTPIVSEVSSKKLGSKKTDKTVTIFNGQWVWPVKGKLARKFSLANGAQGLDIRVASGTPVKASSSGKVVYAGTGLRGYGQLLIVKHSEVFLSAYGHNRKILVEEGDLIRKGQVIAETGSSPNLGDVLHFEIRKNGKPVDPARLLPAQK